MNDHAKRIADKYISRSGGLPSNSDYSNTTKANAAWNAHAEAIHTVLNKTAPPTKVEARKARDAFREIGDAIAQDERRARGRMF